MTQVCGKSLAGGTDTKTPYDVISYNDVIFALNSDDFRQNVNFTGV